ncbi:MAG: CRISPR-associated helicase Cas3', partial [Oscillospiraceae bacterium]
NLAHFDPVTGRAQTVCQHDGGVAQLAEESARGCGLSAAATLAGWVHDENKGCNPKFALRLLHGGTKVDHSTGGGKLIYERYYANGTGAGKLAAQMIALAVCSHHGGMMDCRDVGGEFPFRNRMAKTPEAYEESVAAFFETCQSEQEVEVLFARATQEVRTLYESVLQISLPFPRREPAFYFLLGLAQRFLLSALVDADRYDTFCFYADCPARHPEPRRPLWGRLAAELELHLAQFPRDTDLNRQRGEISDACLAAALGPPGLYELCVPTGTGKTLSGLRFALTAAQQQDAGHIFYIGPFVSIIDQTCDNIRKALHLSPQDETVVEHHSNLVLEDNPNQTDEDELTEKARALLTERWSAPVVLTTLVQFLDTFFAGGNTCTRRLQSLAHSVIVLDEIQAIPMKCMNLFSLAVTFLTQICHSTVVFCTATQPRLAVTDFPLPPPIQMVPHSETLFETLRRVHIVDVRKDGPFTTAQLADFVVEKLADVRSMLVICNTKAAAANLLRLATKATAGDPPLLFHLSTSLCPAHRKKILEELKGALRDIQEQKPGARKVLCITTQLIEAGVDLSAECVVRSFAGLDSLAQAAGRCNRNGEAEYGTVYLVENREENLTYLPDIRAAQKSCRDFLDAFYADPAAYGSDILSPKSIAGYYELYYEAQKYQMDYPIEKNQKGQTPLHGDSSILDLLSCNKVGENARNVVFSQPLNQAFCEAGKRFRVIDSATVAVLVPYGAGADLIAALASDNLRLEDRAKLLRRGQQYGVNLFSWQADAIGKAGIYSLPCGALALRPEYYSETYGVTTSPGQLDFLGY